MNSYLKIRIKVVTWQSNLVKICRSNGSDGVSKMKGCQQATSSVNRDVGQPGWRIFARVSGRPAVKHADLQGRQNDAVLSLSLAGVIAGRSCCHCLRRQPSCSDEVFGLKWHRSNASEPLFSNWASVFFKTKLRTTNLGLKFLGFSNLFDFADDAAGSSTWRTVCWLCRVLWGLCLSEWGFAFVSVCVG